MPHRVHVLINYRTYARCNRSSELDLCLLKNPIKISSMFVYDFNELRFSSVRMSSSRRNQEKYGEKIKSNQQRALVISGPNGKLVRNVVRRRSITNSISRKINWNESEVESMPMPTTGDLIEFFFFFSFSHVMTSRKVLLMTKFQLQKLLS